MKRRDLIKRLEAIGYIIVRRGGNHDVYSNGQHSEPIARHTEINERTENAILKRARA